MNCLVEPKWELFSGKLTWYWGIHHRLLPVSSGSDLVLAVWFSFPAGSCIFFCLALLLLQVCFVPPTYWRREETQEKEKEITVHYHVTMYTAKQKPIREHRRSEYYSTSGRKRRGIKNKKKLTSTKFPEYTSSRVTSRSRTMSLPRGISRPAGCLFPPNINPKSPKKLEKQQQKNIWISVQSHSVDWMCSYSDNIFVSNRHAFETR